MVGCQRCGAVMVQEDFADPLDDSGCYQLVAWRCPLCGHVTDDVMQANRVQPPTVEISRARRR